MEETKTYEHFPLWMVLLSNLFGVSIYAVGAYILAGFGAFVVILYLLYCALIEFRVLKRSCVNCYYYGKLCCFGKGKLASLFLEKGEPKRFGEDEISWRDLLPDFMVGIFPLAGGVLLLTRGFSLPLAVAMTALLILYLGGNAIVRGSFACKYCRQRELGCPAEEVFSKSSNREG